MHTELFVRRMQIGLIDLKMVISISVISQKTLWTSCSYGRGRIAERWEKVVKNDGNYFV